MALPAVKQTAAVQISASEPTQQIRTSVIARDVKRLEGYALNATFGGDSGRADIEQFIAEKFQDVHQAQIEHFLPLLLSASNRNALGAAVGMRFGEQGAMFLEQYLNRPIEQEIAALKEQPVDRHRIVEIGNLVITDRPTGLLLFIVMTGVLAQLGRQWMVFTATETVENMLRKLGYSPFYLADAEASVLGAKAAQWGSYYENHPRVLTGSIDSALHEIQRSPFLSSLYARSLPDIQALSARIAATLPLIRGDV